ncbi:MAG: glycosyltransferase family 2 protein [bacterium]|nr:glycosyltransferase family 2 protein [bacterium]
MKWKVLWEVPWNSIRSAKYRAYYRWLIPVKVKRAFNLVSKDLHIITPSHSYESRSQLLHRAIDSILAQTPHGLKVHHHIVFDGDAPNKILFTDLPAWYSYEIISTPRTAMYGAHQRNVGLEKVKTGWILFFDDDNVIDPNCCKIIEQYIHAGIGVLVFRVWHEELKKYVPEDLTAVPKFVDIDSLSFVVNADIAHYAEWQHKYHHDYLYIQNIIGIGEYFGFRTVVNDDIIGIHY